MNLPNQTYPAYLWLLLTLFHFPITAQTVHIIESQSFNSLHRMDRNWQNASNALGYPNAILPQESLDDLSNFSNTDLLILASGVISLNHNQLQTLKQYVRNGGNLYVQAEYLTSAQGNYTFKYLTEQLGGQFQWNGETNGQLQPLALSPVISQQDSLHYFWYGAHGSGDESIIPFIHRNGLDYGFIFCADRMDYGKIVTTSDQDWIRLNRNQILLEEILEYLLQFRPMAEEPEILIEASVLRPCDGETIEFTTQISNVAGQEHLQWLVNGQPVHGATAPTWVFDNYQDGDVVECQLTLDNGCRVYEKTSNQFLIDPINSLVVSVPVVQSDTARICADQAARFWASVDLNGVQNPRYEWLLNNHPIPNSNHLNLTLPSFSATDSVQIKMIYDDNCNTGIELVSSPVGLEVIDVIRPEIHLISDRTVICDQESITFTLTGNNWGNDPMFQWIIDDEVIPVSSDTFTADHLTDGQVVRARILPRVTCPAAAYFETEPIQIQVQPLLTPRIGITRLDDALCEEELYSFVASIQNGGPKPLVTWLIDGVPTGSTGQTFSTTRLRNGQTVSAALISDATCVTTREVSAAPIEMQLQVLAEPAVTIERNQPLVCPGAASTFTANGIHLGTSPRYEWFVDDVPLGINAPVFTQVLQPGQQVSCQVISDKVCTVRAEANSNVLDAFISDLRVEEVEIVAANCSEQDGQAQVVATGGMPPYRYEWNTGHRGASITGLTPGDHHVTVTDNAGCQAELILTVPGESLPLMEDLLLEQPDCHRNQGNATVRMIEEGPYEFAWYNEADEMISTSFYAFDLKPGQYELVVSTPQGCSATHAFEIYPAENPQIQLPRKLQTKEGEAINLEPAVAPSQLPLSYEWFPAEGLSCTDCPTPVATPTVTTVYTLTVSTPDGCSKSTEVIVEVSPNQDCYIPNVFSPNGDGFNDFFTVFGSQQTEEILHLQIFDRWGNQLFGGRNLPTGFEQVGWDGTLKERPAPAGVYVYSALVRYKNGQVQRFTGDLTLVR